MFVYALLKGVRLGMLEVQRGDSRYVDSAVTAYKYISITFVVDYGNGTLGWNGTVGVCTLNSSASYEVRLYTVPSLDWREVLIV